MVKETSDANFQKDILESPQRVLVDFWAPWCGPCRMVGPVIDRISEQLEGKVDFFKIDVDENPSTSQEYEISGIPTILIFENGKKIDELVGVQPEGVYLERLQS